MQAKLLSLLVFDLDPGTEEDLAILLGGVIDNLQLIETLGEITDAAIDLAQQLLIIVIL